MSVTPVLDLSLRALPGVGPVRQRLLQDWGIFDLRDLLERIPRDYRVFSWADGAQALRDGQPAMLRGQVVGGQVRRSPRSIVVLQVSLRDLHGSDVELVWFLRGRRAVAMAHQRLQRLRKGGEWLVLGTPERKGRKWTINQPELSPYRELNSELVIRPIYPTTSGVRERQLATWIGQALPHVSSLFPEFLPTMLRRRWQLCEREQAWMEVHRPRSLAGLREARRRLAFDEALLFFLRLRMARREEALQTDQAPAFLSLERRVGAGSVRRRSAAPSFQSGALSAAFLQQLPFQLTGDQKRVLQEIDSDLARGRPMRRLLQGDVGTGKTVLAAYALARAVESGYQGAVMAPTELLAEQLAEALHSFLGPLGVNVAFLSGSLSAARRRALLEALRSERAAIVVGTQALLADDVFLPRLGIVIIDEQHRFGVSQREQLLRGFPTAGEQARHSGKQRLAINCTPHYLAMSATPIPRSLSLVLMGDMDVSLLMERPAGRSPVDTRWLPESRRSRAYDFVRRLVGQGQQAYVVYPRLEEQEAQTPADREGLAPVPDAARQGWAFLRSGPLRGLDVELLHAKMPDVQKEYVMRDFRAGRIDVLVSTTVVEVGVDVPNATVMLIEEPDRFGLAQLHQLRGRVGRGALPGYCLLIGDGRTAASRSRLRLFRQCHDGFTLAEHDLKLRGPGDVLGLRQSGRMSFRFLDPLQDEAILQMGREAAEALVELAPSAEEDPSPPSRREGFGERKLPDWDRIHLEMVRSFARSPQREG